MTNIDCDIEIEYEDGTNNKAENLVVGINKETSNINMSLQRTVQLVEPEAIERFVIPKIRTGVSEFKRFACVRCHKTFLTKEEIMKHNLTHASEKLYTCEICNRHFVDLLSLDKHIMDLHQDDATSIMQRSVSHIGRIVYHAIPVSSSDGNSKSIFCQVCKSEFPESVTDTKKLSVKCVNCNEATPIKAAPKTMKYVRCICNYLQVCKEDVTRISCIRENCKRVIVLVAFDTFNIKSDYNRKISVQGRTYEDDEDRRFICHECNAAFYTLNHLKTHHFIHTGLRPFKCGHCNATFKTKGHLKSHSYMHTEDKQVECSICFKKFKSEIHLRRHILTHTAERTYKCSICNASFMSNYQLERHHLTHTGEKPYECSICNRAFTRKENLRKHMLIHTNEKPYVCDVCDVKFARSDYLSNHKLIHTNSKALTCHVCDKSFLTKYYLNRHLFTHAGVKNHICKKCNKTFRDFFSLKRHRVIHKTAKKTYRCPNCFKKFSLKFLVDNHLCHLTDVTDLKVE